MRAFAQLHHWGLHKGVESVVCATPAAWAAAGGGERSSSVALPKVWHTQAERSQNGRKKDRWETLVTRQEGAALKTRKTAPSSEQSSVAGSDSLQKAHHFTLKKNK